MKKLLIVWGNWGPYHYARFRSLHERAAEHGVEAHGLELFPSSGYYDWQTAADHPAVHHLALGKIETEFNLFQLTTKLLPLLFKLKPDVIFVPSYWHWSLFINFAGRLRGAKIVMMNESHGGTEQARGITRMIKKAVVRRFHSALVGGSPHRRHFASLGLKSSCIHFGYDAIDNDYFTSQSERGRENAAALRRKLQLPDRYFLSLGRMVKKKNLAVLVEAFARLTQSHPQQDLVFVGSGEENENLRALCRRLNLAVIDHTQMSNENNCAPVETAGLAMTSKRRHAPIQGDRTPSESRPPSVHFYGFRQIDENPIFYALATAFILPSSREEWGLVVNEAMACGLPVIVSKKAGCAEDLVESGRNGFTFDPESAEELCEALLKLSDPSVATPMGAHSLTVAQHWGCERFASGALDATETALRNPSYE